MEEYKEKIHEDILVFLEKLDQEKKPSREKQSDNEPTNTSREAQQNQLILKLLTVDQYFTQIIEDLQQLLNKGYAGIYISFQRPANNLQNLFHYYSIDTKKLQIIDIASELTTHDEEPHPSSSETYIPNLISKIQSEINNIQTSAQIPDQFLIIDSVSTMALYLNHTQIMQLITLIEKELLTTPNTQLVIYGAKELSTQKILMDIENYFKFMTSTDETTNQKIQPSSRVST